MEDRTMLTQSTMTKTAIFGIVFLVILTLLSAFTFAENEASTAVFGVY